MPRRQALAPPSRNPSAGMNLAVLPREDADPADSRRLSAVARSLRLLPAPSTERGPQPSMGPTRPELLELLARDVND